MIDNARNEVRNEEGCGAINPCCSGVAWRWSDRRGEQLKKVPPLGYLAAVSPAAYAARTEPLRQGLHKLGYVEGKNIVIEWRFAPKDLRGAAYVFAYG